MVPAIKMLGRKATKVSPLRSVEEVRRQVVVRIEPEAKRKLDAYITYCNREISGLGYVRQLDDNSLLVYDLDLLEQSVTTATTDLDEAAVEKYILRAIEEGKPVDELKVWWHSHASMSSYFSSTDEDTINKLGVDYWVSIVGNHKLEYEVRVDMYTPFRGIMEDATFTPYYEDEFDFNAEIQDEIDALVTVETPMIPSQFGKGGYPPATQYASQIPMKTLEEMYSDDDGLLETV